MKHSESLSFIQAYYRSVLRECVVASFLQDKSIFPVFLFRDKVGEFANVEDRNKPTISLHPVQLAHQEFMNEVYDWCMEQCGPYGFTPVLTGYNDYLATRDREDALMRGVMIECDDHATLFKLTFSDHLSGD